MLCVVCCVVCCGVCFVVGVVVGVVVCVVWPVATIKRFIVTPAVCPPLFEFLTTLTFGALCKNHFVSTTFEAITKKNA